MYPFTNSKQELLWRKAMDLAIAVNHCVRNFPQHEREKKGLYSQLLQTSIRITFRIVESQTPILDSERDILLRARYHLSETEFLLDVSHIHGYIDKSDRLRLNENCQELRSLINKEIQDSTIYN
jgi:four helix bundle protein